MRFVVVTGISGAGKSQALKALEDMGYFCVDNIPPRLIPRFAEIMSTGATPMEHVALVADIRSKEMFAELIPCLGELGKVGVSYEILFLDCSDQVIIKRYKETRRQHPLTPEGGRLSEGIARERAIMSEIRQMANHLIDTSNISTRQCREELYRIFVEGRTLVPMVINVTSFGFKYGPPIDCDLVFDVRFIPNPYYIDEMRPLSGLDEPVRKYVCEAAETIEFSDRLTGMLSFLIPNYIREGKSQLVIGIGCTGGRHRSVAIAQQLHSWLSARDYSCFVEHRDIEKDGRR